jgi:predicted aspartyl protease
MNNAILGRVFVVNRVIGRATWVILLAGILIPASQAPAKPQAAQASPQFEALPLTRSRQNHLLVRASVNGKPATFAVDTGAPFSAISSRRREHFGVTSLPATSNLPAGVQVNGVFNRFAVAATLQLGSLNLIDEPLVVIDLSAPRHGARSLHEQDIDGILGADILFPTKAVLDCQTEMLILKVDPEARGTAPGISYHGFRRMPLRVSDGYNLYVDGAVNGIPARLMVDTGAFATLLHRRFVREMKIPLYQTRFRSAAVNLKQHRIELAQIRRLSVGKIDIINTDVGVVDLQGLIDDELLDGKPPVAGLLGAEILRSHHGIVDFGTRTLYLKR